MLCPQHCLNLIQSFNSCCLTQYIDFPNHLHGHTLEVIITSDSSQVSIGTIVDVLSSDGSNETFTILGAWDSDAEKGIMSYLSATGKALTGHKVGESVELQTDEGGTRNVTIEQVGDTAAFLASGLADGITGQVIYVDGGYEIMGM